MNASKENAAECQRLIREGLLDGLFGGCQLTKLGVEFVAAFLDAATRKLPCEATIEKHRQKPGRPVGRPKGSKNRPC